MTTVRTLIQVIPYEFTGEEIAKINQANRTERHTDQILPEYFFSDSGLSMIGSDWCYYYYDSPEILDDQQKKENVILFDLHPVSSEMQHEFSDMGAEWIINDCGNSDDFRKIVGSLPKNNFDNFARTACPIEHFIVFDITYTKSYDHYSGGWEYETEIEIVGHLDSKMQLVEIK